MWTWWSPQVDCDIFPALALQSRTESCRALIASPTAIAATYLLIGTTVASIVVIKGA
jgi:hypothetical protein